MMYSLLRAAVAEITGIAPATDFAKPRSNPQPTQTQAGAVPLTDAQAQELIELESRDPDAIGLYAQLVAHHPSNRSRPRHQRRPAWR